MLEVIGYALFLMGVVMNGFMPVHKVMRLC